MRFTAYIHFVLNKNQTSDLSCYRKRSASQTLNVNLTELAENKALTCPDLIKHRYNVVILVIFSLFLVVIKGFQLPPKLQKQKTKIGILDHYKHKETQGQRQCWVAPVKVFKKMISGHFFVFSVLITIHSPYSEDKYSFTVYMKTPAAAEKNKNLEDSGSANTQS